MKSEELLRAILPDVLIDNFEVERFEKTDIRFDIWLDEKKEQLRYKKGENEPWNADFHLSTRALYGIFGLKPNSLSL